MEELQAKQVLIPVFFNDASRSSRSFNCSGFTPFRPPLLIVWLVFDMHPSIQDLLFAKAKLKQQKIANEGGDV
jgi:hypothetical protein